MAESRRTRAHLLRTPKLQLIAKQPLTGECWIPPEKDTPRPRAKENPRQDSRRVKSRSESNPIPLGKVMLKFSKQGFNSM